jgi:S1-C subfamily serine protease
LRLEKSYSFRRGDDVTIIGNPGLGDSVTLQNAITKGVMSTETTIEGRRFYQLGASVNPGNSGGPVFDTQGRVIGIVASKAERAEAVGFCIPIEDLVHALNRLPALTTQQLAEAEKTHNIRVVCLRTLMAGVVYRFQLDSYLDSIDRAIKGGGTIDDGILAVAKQCTARAADVRANLERDVLPELTSIARDKDIPEDVRRDLRELWTTCADMKSYIDEPRGSFITLSQKVRELKDRFDHLAESLRISVGVGD